MTRLEDAAASGDRRDALEALRDELAREIAEGSSCVKCGGGLSSSTAALAKQLRDTLNELSAIAVPEGSLRDELKSQRAKRQTGVAKRSGRSAEHGA